MNPVYYALGIFKLVAIVAATANVQCLALAALLRNQVFFPSDKAFNESISSFAYAQQQRQIPTCIVIPRDTLSVAGFVGIMKTSPLTKFALRSGGHSTNRGFSNIDAGILLDLSTLNAVSLHPDSNIVSVGTGARWRDVYRVLDASHRSLNGGRASGVGVGGFLSGGGIGFFALEHGFGCDAITNIEIVLSTGAIVRANERSHTDLFTAVKGGQNNFGIVTRWDIETIAKEQMWGGSIVYPESTTAEQIQVFTEWKSPANFDPSTSVEQSHVYIGSSDTYLVSNSIFSTDAVADRKSLRGYTSIKPQLTNSLRFSNVSDFAEEIQSFSTPNQFSIFATTTLKISPTILIKVHNAWKKCVANTPSYVKTTSSLTLQSIPSPARDPLRPNSLGFDPASTPQKDLVLVLISIFWENIEASKEIEEITARFITSVEFQAKQEGVQERYKYMNYAAAQFENPLKTTGELEKLRDVASTYDPIKMFQKQLIGGWKLEN